MTTDRYYAIHCPGSRNWMHEQTTFKLLELARATRHTEPAYYAVVVSVLDTRYFHRGNMLADLDAE